jgi:hypothetical protein
MNFARKISQLFFDFNSQPAWEPVEGPLFDSSKSVEVSSEASAGKEAIKEISEDATLTQVCQLLLEQIGLPGMAKVVHVFWNPRLRSTAGYASYPSWWRRHLPTPGLREVDA